MKTLRRLLLIFVLIACTAGSIFVFYSYRQYEALLAQEPLSQAVQRARSMKGYVTYQEISPHFIDALVATEDRRFFERRGFDFRAFFRAVLVNYESGALKEGGSTIPQQVGKLLYYDHKQTLSEKIEQVMLMYDLERAYTKEEIFELYANLTPYGDGIIGVANASNAYFKVRPNKLTYPQASLLAGLPQAPSAYAPRHHFDRAKLRQKKVLQNCVDVEYITQKEADEYYKTRLKIF